MNLVTEQALNILTQSMEMRPLQRLGAWRQALDLVRAEGYALGYQAANLDRDLTTHMEAMEAERHQHDELEDQK
ncbi:hypothetical protein [Nonomuraea sp. NPDC003214]